jgi:hypothetical protein
MPCCGAHAQIYAQPMTDFTPDQAAADYAEVERDMRRRLTEIMDMCAKFDEEIVDLTVLGLGRTRGRKPSNAIERELTVELNSIGQLLQERARDECPGPAWQGLADAAVLISNHIGRRGLPQLMHDDYIDDEQPV